MTRLKRILVLLTIVGLVVGFSCNAWAEEGKDKININTATLEQLTQLKGVGEVTAKKIIDYREKAGLFKSVQDLTNVKGIGSKILSDNMDLITI